MIEMLFGIRFYSQFHRTKPELVKKIQTNLHDLVLNSGGVVTRIGREVSAQFSEESFGFSIQFLTFLQQIIPFCDAAKKNLFGFSILFRKENNDEEKSLVKKLFHTKQGIPIFFDSDTTQILAPYCYFEAIPPYSLFWLKEFKKMPEIRPPSLDELIARFKNELDNSNTRCKILVGNDEDLLANLVREYSAGTYQETAQFHISFRLHTASLGGFIELLMQSSKETAHPFIVPEETIKRIGSERLHHNYNEAVISMLYEIMNRWITHYEPYPLVLLISNLDCISPSLEPVANKFIHDFLEANSHIVLITALSKEKLSWIEGIDKQFIVFQSQERPVHTVSDVLYQYREWEDLWATAYLCHRFSCIYTKSEVPVQIQRSGFSSVSLEFIQEKLEKIGVFPWYAPDFMLSSILEKLIINTLPAVKIQNANKLVQKRLLESLKEQELKPGILFLSAFIAVDGSIESDLLLDSILQDMAGNYYAELEQAIQSKSLERMIGPRLTPAVVYILRTTHLLESDLLDEIQEFARLSIPESTDSPRIEAYCYMNRASLLLMSGDSEPAGQDIKHALLVLQDYQNKNGLEKVYRLFGLIELAHHRIEDSIEYLSFALEAAQKNGNIHERAITSFYAAVAYFLLGSMPRAIFYCENAIQTFKQCDLEAWSQKARFLLGRIQFLLGNYDDSTVIFQSISAGSVTYFWALRSQLYSSSHNRERLEQLFQKYKGLSSRDVLLEQEFNYFLGNYEECIRISDIYDSHESVFVPIITERPDWYDGYSQIEYILFPRQEIIKRQIKCFKALSLSHTQPKSQNITAIMDSIFDELKPYVYDPFDVFYHSCYYLAIQQMASSEIDKATALSGAFKRLQKRAGRIEDAEMRRNYLTSNYWNGLLSSSAKMHNLI